jgi:NAD(P)-dependent dehydrogenase (short-subunit alcohol dehydrogenase family)
MEISLDGKVALVTGASRGIGKAIAASMAAAGAKVMLNSRKQDALEAAAAEMTGDVDVFAANAGDDDAGQRAVLATIERFGGLDILVNNAATNPFYGPMMDVDKGRYDKTFQVNLDAPIFWTQAAYEHALKDKPGVVINIASVGGLRAEGGLGVYNLTKAAVIHLTRQLASEIGPTSPPTSSTTSATAWLLVCRSSGSATHKTSPTSPSSSQATWRAGSLARPTSSMAAPASQAPESDAQTIRRSLPRAVRGSDSTSVRRFGAR